MYKFLLHEGNRNTGLEPRLLGLEESNIHISSVRRTLQSMAVYSLTDAGCKITK